MATNEATTTADNKEVIELRKKLSRLRIEMAEKDAQMAEKDAQIKQAQSDAQKARKEANHYKHKSNLQPAPSQYIWISPARGSASDLVNNRLALDPRNMFVIPSAGSFMPNSRFRTAQEQADSLYRYFQIKGQVPQRDCKKLTEAVECVDSAELLIFPKKMQELRSHRYNTRSLNQIHTSREKATSRPVLDLFMDVVADRFRAYSDSCQVIKLAGQQARCRLGTLPVSGTETNPEPVIFGKKTEDSTWQPLLGSEAKADHHALLLCIPQACGISADSAHLLHSRGYKLARCAVPAVLCSGNMIQIAGAYLIPMSLPVYCLLSEPMDINIYDDFLKGVAWACVLAKFGIETLDHEDIDFDHFKGIALNPVATDHEHPKKMSKRKIPQERAEGICFDALNHFVKPVRAPAPRKYAPLPGNGEPFSASSAVSDSSSMLFPTAGSANDFSFSTAGSSSLPRDRSRSTSTPPLAPNTRSPRKRSRKTSKSQRPRSRSLSVSRSRSLSRSRSRSRSCSRAHQQTELNEWQRTTAHKSILNTMMHVYNQLWRSADARKFVLFPIGTLQVPSAGGSEEPLFQELTRKIKADLSKEHEKIPPLTPCLVYQYQRDWRTDLRQLDAT